MIKFWNNSSDCNEYYCFPPFDKNDNNLSGFPNEYENIINNISDSCPSLKYHSELSNFITEAIQTDRYALVKEVPEDTDSHNKYYLSFGLNSMDDYMVCPVSIQLGVDKPDWNIIQEKLCFMPGKSFVEFSESFPAVVFGHIDSPSFIVEPCFFTDVSKFLPEDMDGKVDATNEEIKQLDNCLFFQVDYWGVYRFVNKDNKVCELRMSPFSFTNTNIAFDSWVSEQMKAWNELGNR